MTTPESDTPATLLFVDDEANILSALKRLFRPKGYRVLTAEGGAEALEILEKENIDLVVSDMRMPEMDGAQLLERVRQRWPDTVRILLTGYADVSSTIDAINKGQILRYVAKPWEDNDLLLTVQQAIERKQLQREKARLEALTIKQNQELRFLNEGLEDIVRARTQELQQTMAFLESANERLKKSLVMTVRVFANLIELRHPILAGHSRRVADQSRALAVKMGMKDAEVQDVMLAGFLHDIGKIGFPDSLLDKSFASLTDEERRQVVKHPATGQNALMALENLAGAAKLIRGHHERFDGQGFPDHLSGLSIPLGARILAVVNDYDAAQLGTLFSKKLGAQEAATFIQEARGKRYDPGVVDAFLEMLGVARLPETEQSLRAGQLLPGMVLTQDVMTPEGLLLLARDTVLDQDLIAQLRAFETTEKILLTVFARRG
jgi:response regulator RpfG family c-di-GMP phosphodiesterase